MKALRKMSLSLVVALASLGTATATPVLEGCCGQGKDKECTCCKGCCKQEDKSKVIVCRKSSIEEAYIEVDGKEISQEEMNKLDPNKIESVQVLKDKSSLSKLGDKLKGRVSAIIITTKK